MGDKARKILSLLVASGKSLLPSKNLLFGKTSLINTGMSLKSGTVEASFVQSGCLDFDGTNDYVALLNKITHVLNTNNPFSFRCFVNMDSVLAVYLFNTYNLTEQKGINIVLTSGMPTLLIRSTTSNNIKVAMTNPALVINTTYELHFTYNGSKNGSGVTLAINRIAMTPDIQSNNLTADDITPTTPTTYICCTHTGSATANFTNGRIWGVKMWSTVVTATNDTTIADILDLPFGCGNGGLVCDCSGNNNHGILTNFTLPTAWAIKQNVFHSNISKGFSTFSLGNGTDGYYKIDESRFKQRGTSNFWIRSKVLIRTSASNQGIAGSTYSGGANRYGFFISSTNTLSVRLNIGAVSLSGETGILTDGSFADCFLNVNRSGNAEFWVNGVLIASADISSEVATNFICGNSMYIHQFGNTTDIPTPSYYSLSYIGLVSMGTGLLPTNGSHDAVTPDICDFVQEPNGTRLIDRVTNTYYSVTSGTIYNVKSPSKNSDNTKDLNGNSILYPAGNYHNGAETLLDFTNGGTYTSIKESIGNVWYMRNSSNLYRVLTNIYGTWSFYGFVDASTSFFGLYSSASTSITTNSYNVTYNSSTIILNKRVASASTNLVSVSGLSLAVGTPFYVLVERNETDNQYFTGVANTFRMSLKGHKAEYPINGASLEVIGTATDTSFTTIAGYVLIRPVTRFSLFRINGNLESLSSYTQSVSGEWFALLESFYFNAPWYNPAFYRKIYQDTVNIVRNDRFLIYSTYQITSALTKITKYIKDKFL